MIPNPDHVQAIMAATCAGLTRVGWGQAPRLLALRDSTSPIQGLADPHLVQAEELPIPEASWAGGEPGAHLYNLAVNLAWLMPRPYVNLLMDYVDPTFAGYLCVVEKPARRTRRGVAVDTVGNVYQVEQDRGQAPSSSWVPVGADIDVQPGGRIVNALRLLTIVACDRMPTDAHRMPKLLVPSHGETTSVDEMLQRMGLVIPDVCSCTDDGDPSHHRDYPQVDPSLN